MSLMYQLLKNKILIYSAFPSVFVYASNNCIGVVPAGLYRKIAIIGVDFRSSPCFFSFTEMLGFFVKFCGNNAPESHLNANI